MGKYSLGFVDRFGHGEEDAVEENGAHDDVIEELVGGQVNGSSSKGIPRGEQKQGLGCREPMNVILPETF